MVDQRNTYGFPLPPGITQDDLDQHNAACQARAYNYAQNNAFHSGFNNSAAYANAVGFSTRLPLQSKLAKAKAIAAEVCARRFPVKRIPKEDQHD